MGISVASINHKISSLRKKGGVDNIDIVVAETYREDKVFSVIYDGMKYTVLKTKKVENKNLEVLVEEQIVCSTETKSPKHALYIYEKMLLNSLN